MNTGVVDQLLARQQGMATRQQLRAAGLTRRSLERAVAGGVLRRERAGLDASGDRPVRGLHLLSGGRPDLGYLAEVRAVLLTLGGQVTASRRTAAVLWGFDLFVEPAGVEVDVVPSRSRADRPGVDARRRRPDDVRQLVVRGTAPVRVTSPLQTVLDCAAVRPLAEVVADTALRSRLVRWEELQTAAAFRQGVASAEPVRRVLRVTDPRCGSVLESLLRVLLAEHGILVPRTQYVVRTANGRFVGRVDFCWPEQRLIVEADGRRWHDPEDARDRDRRRSNAYARLGWAVLRFTWAEVVHEPADVVSAVRECLALRSVRSADSLGGQAVDRSATETHAA